MAHDRMSNWKVDEDQVVRNRIRELGLFLRGNSKGPPGGQAAQGWDGNGLRARPPIRRLVQEFR